MSNPINAIEKHERAKLIKGIKADYAEKKRAERVSALAISFASIAIGVVFSVLMLSA